MARLKIVVRQSQVILYSFSLLRPTKRNWPSTTFTRRKGLLVPSPDSLCKEEGGKQDEVKVTASDVSSYYLNLDLFVLFFFFLGTSPNCWYKLITSTTNKCHVHSWPRNEHTKTVRMDAQKHHQTALHILYQVTLNVEACDVVVL